uniref:Uncharacterized protein n=1 Tax=Tanacetum cinerariifolium TaxID=118510 RepID=A0A699GN93_TANCI|nr:hypothetical protein [Tanacetum cinerariifolium]
MLVIKIFCERKKVLERQRSVRKFVQRGLIFCKEWSSIYKQENPTVTGDGPSSPRYIRRPPGLEAGRSIDYAPFFCLFVGKEEHPKCCQAKGSKDEEKLVHLKMVVKFKVLIEKKKMYSHWLDEVGLVDVVFDGAIGGVRDEEIVVGEGVVVTSSSLEMLTNSCLGGIMVSLLFLEGLEEEALVEHGRIV